MHGSGPRWRWTSISPLQSCPVCGRLAVATAKDARSSKGGRPGLASGGTPTGEGSGSESVGADDLASGPGPEGPPSRQVDRILDELDGAVCEGDVNPARVVARRGGDAPATGRGASLVRIDA